MGFERPRMARSRKSRMKQWVLEETVTDLRKVKMSELYLYDEYLIEIAEAPDGERYHARIYELVAKGPACNDPQAALRKAVNLLDGSGGDRVDA